MGLFWRLSNFLSSEVGKSSSSQFWGLFEPKSRFVNFDHQMFCFKDGKNLFAGFNRSEASFFFETDQIELCSKLLLELEVVNSQHTGGKLGICTRICTKI